MDDLDAVRRVAQDLLVLPGHARPDAWLAAHARRVGRTAAWLATASEHRADGARPEAAEVAGLFSLAGWPAEVRAGRVAAEQVLQRPTNATQREAAAALLESHCRARVDEETLARAARAIRQANDRYPDVPEARVLVEAENLAEIGVTDFLRQLRAAAASDDPVRQLLTRWRRQQEYGYWEARIRDCLRSEVARRAALERLANVQRCFDNLASELGEPTSSNASDLPARAGE